MNNRAKFVEAAQEMWQIGVDGVYLCLQPDLNEISNPLLRAILPKKNVEIYYVKTGTHLKVYIKESDDIYDWMQNFMAWYIKTEIDGIKMKVHAGFYITSMTVFNYLRRVHLIEEGTTVELCGYSHGASCVPHLGLLIDGRSKATLVQDNGKWRSHEAAKTFKKPSQELKDKCKNLVRYKQGNDIVTTVAPGYEHVGQEVLVGPRSLENFDTKGLVRKLSGFLVKWIKPIQCFIDHDIYDTMTVEQKAYFKK